MSENADSWDEWFKNRKSIFEKFFEEVFREMEEMDKALDAFGPIRPEDIERFRRPLTWGFKYHLGPDGKPAISEFGNVRRKGGIPKVVEENEPLTDVMEKDDAISVVAELPGVEKDDIDVRCDGRAVTITAKSEKRQYSKEIPLPAEVLPKSGVARYKNGILELTFKKKATSSISGEQIKVE